MPEITTDINRIKSYCTELTPDVRRHHYLFSSVAAAAFPIIMGLFVWGMVASGDYTLESKPIHFMLGTGIALGIITFLGRLYVQRHIVRAFVHPVGYGAFLLKPPGIPAKTQSGEIAEGLVVFFKEAAFIQLGKKPQRGGLCFYVEPPRFDESSQTLIFKCNFGKAKASNQLIDFDEEWRLELPAPIVEELRVKKPELFSAK